MHTEHETTKLLYIQFQHVILLHNWKSSFIRITAPRGRKQFSSLIIFKSTPLWGCYQESTIQRIKFSFINQTKNFFSEVNTFATFVTVSQHKTKSCNWLDFNLFINTFLLLPTRYQIDYLYFCSIQLLFPPPFCTGQDYFAWFSDF